MSEKFPPNNETIPDKNYTELKAAENEVSKILKEIDRILLTVHPKEEAEKIILEKFAPKMDQALEKEKQAMEKWVRSLELNVRDNADHMIPENPSSTEGKKNPESRKERLARLYADKYFGDPYEKDLVDFWDEFKDQQFKSEKVGNFTFIYLTDDAISGGGYLFSMKDIAPEGEDYLDEYSIYVSRDIETAYKFYDALKELAHTETDPKKFFELAKELRKNKEYDSPYYDKETFEDEEDFKQLRDYRDKQEEENNSN